MVAIPDDAIVVVFGGNAYTAINVASELISNRPNFVHTHRNVICNFFTGNTDYYFMDYPCSGMSKKASTPHIFDGAYNLYLKVLEDREQTKRPLWVLTISIGMSVFASILPRLQDNDQQPDVIVCMNGLMSMRKTLMKIAPITRLYYHGLGGDFNTARLISQHLDPKVQFYWIQNMEDALIDLHNLENVVQRWRTDNNIHIHLIWRNSREIDTHNDINLVDALVLVKHHDPDLQKCKCLKNS